MRRSLSVANKAFASSTKPWDLKPVHLKQYVAAKDENWTTANETARVLRDLRKPVSFTVFHNPTFRLAERYVVRFIDEIPNGVEVEVLERVPSAEEWAQILRCKNREPGFMQFFAQHPRDRPLYAQEMHEIVFKYPENLKWPIIVNWETGDIATGKDRGAARAMLRPLRIRRPLDPEK